VVELPTGTVTFLFADVEGSTQLLLRLGDGYADVLAEYRRVLREIVDRSGGLELDTQGDSFFAVFGEASSAVRAATAIQEALADQPLKARIGLHTGEALVTDEGYVGLDVHRAARIGAAGHGGQILISHATKVLTTHEDVRDLGRHRLKDLVAPERIFQLGAGTFPPLRSLNQTNLPVQATPLVGRKRELREIGERIQTFRVVTLTGAGGSGKTRLALQAAAGAIDDFPDGVWFVSLGSVRDVNMVEPTISQVIGARDEMHAFLQGKRLLLVLDNLEQLLPEVAPIIVALEVAVLATSRERLRISAECEYPVPTMPTDDATTLFVDRARQLKPDFEADDDVVEIVRRLGGLPLAVELAAARVKVLSSRQIAERLGAGLAVLATHVRDAPARQRTLEATVDWSYTLLTSIEQRAFSGLSVFVGGFTADAAESVADADLDVLTSLVDKNLVVCGHERFDMLEVIRQYAVTQLRGTSNDEHFRLRHARYFLSLANDAHHSRQWSLTMQNEHENVLAALNTFHVLERPELELELAVAASSYWHLVGQHVQGRERLAVALERAPQASAALRARAFQKAASLSHDLGDYSAAERLTREHLRVAGASGVVASAPLISLGIAAEERGDLDRAESLYTSALENARRARSKIGIAVALSNIGNNALARGDRTKAAQFFRESLRIARDLDDSEGIAIGLSNLALVALGDGDEDAAFRCYREAFDVTTSVGFSGGIIWSALGVAALEVEDDAALAARLLGAADALLGETGRVLGHEERRLQADVLQRAQADLSSARF
jgi:predicted ATPase/class 3 adenylate cyclase